jgi:hypothetical protein
MNVLVEEDWRVGKRRGAVNECMAKLYILYILEYGHILGVTKCFSGHQIMRAFGSSFMTPFS